MNATRSLAVKLTELNDSTFRIDRLLEATERVVGNIDEGVTDEVALDLVAIGAIVTQARVILSALADQIEALQMVQAA